MSQDMFYNTGLRNYGLAHVVIESGKSVQNTSAEGGGETLSFNLPLYEIQMKQ